VPQIAAEDGVGPGPVGEDLGGGSPDVQAPTTFESRTGSKKISGRFEEDLHVLVPHAVPGWAAD